MSKPSLTRVARQLFNQPVLVPESWACVLLSAARSRLNVDLIERVDGVTLDQLAMQDLAAEAGDAVTEREARRAGKVYQVIDGVAMIPIEGTLTRSWGLEPSSGFTGYDGIKTKVVAAFDDDDVDAIYLDIDSPGGAVAGLFDLVDTIYALREDGEKPIAAIANEQATSAAQALLSCGSPGLRFCPRTGEVGSVGVLWLYTNVEKAMQQEGIAVRIFRAGKRKAEGNAYETMSDEAATKIQGELEEIRTLFINTLARNLASDDGADVETLKKSIRETEGLTYIGQHARDIGLVDTVGSEDQLWTQLMARLGR